MSETIVHVRSASSTPLTPTVQGTTQLTSVAWSDRCTLDGDCRQTQIHIRVHSLYKYRVHPEMFDQRDGEKKKNENILVIFPHNILNQLYATNVNSRVLVYNNEHGICSSVTSLYFHTLVNFT